MSAIQSPQDLYTRLERQVIDQRTALEQIAITLYKHIKGLKIGNIMLIGNSGTGKTTIMRAIEAMFAADGDLAQFVNTIRLNANIVANEDSQALETSVILERLNQNAVQILGRDGTPERFRQLMENGVVFLDEVDKIRAKVGDGANARGILAQEALLTLIEGETVQFPFTCKDESGQLVQHEVAVNTGRILFICGGAFEGLYDMVYRRVASGEHRDKLVQEYLVEDNQDELNQKEHFSLHSYVRYEDLFEYGMTPQFLGRFDEIIVLNDLTVKGMMRIFVEPANSMFRDSRKYFRSLGIDLQITKEGLRRLAERAHENHRLGARALRMVYKRVIRGVEFDPNQSYLVQEKEGKRVLLITREVVDAYS